MQNRYVGDIGDFGKLGLLRCLREKDLTIGVNWYLVPDEKHNGDGRHTHYLNDKAYGICDEELWRSLGRLVKSNERSIAFLQDSGCLDAIFFSTCLDYRGRTKCERKYTRNNWHHEALTRLEGLDIVFVDPDNGLLVPSAVNTPRDNKYVSVDELRDYYKQGSSIIYYQHKARKNDDFYEKQHRMLLEIEEFEGATGLLIKFRTTSQRYYGFIIQPRHRDRILERVEWMMSTEWKKHFCLL